MNKILPCPSCGEGWYLSVEDDGFVLGNNDKLCHVVCDECDMCGPSTFGESEPIELWNSLPRTKWINVEDRLPPVGQRVVVCLSPTVRNYDEPARYIAYLTDVGSWRLNATWILTSHTGKDGVMWWHELLDTPEGK